MITVSSDWASTQSSVTESGSVQQSRIVMHTQKSSIYVLNKHTTDVSVTEHEQKK